MLASLPPIDKTVPGQVAVESANHTSAMEDGNQPSQEVPQDPVPPNGYKVIKLQSPDEVLPVIKTVVKDGITHHQIYIIDVIGYAGPKYYQDVVNTLDAAQENEVVDMYIASPGGILSAAARIVASMNRCKAPVNTIAMAPCASAGVYLWMNGKTKSVEPGAYLMFHMSSHGDWGNSEAIRIGAENAVQYAKNVCIDPAVEQGLLTAEEAEDIIDRRQDVYIDSVEMTRRLEASNVR